MEQDLEFIELFELYKDLLTKTQCEMFNSHCLLDLSLQEVADEFGTSRQSVYDAIKKVKCKLTEFEKILHLKEKNDLLNALVDRVDNEKLKQEIKGIASI